MMPAQLKHRSHMYIYTYLWDAMNQTAGYLVERDVSTVKHTDDGVYHDAVSTETRVHLSGKLTLYWESRRDHLVPPLLKHTHTYNNN